MSRGTVAALVLACGLVAIQLLHFCSLIVADPDEGVYVYAGRLIAEGLLPYRDFMLAHPPLLPAFVAAVWKFAPDLLAVRAAYLVVVSALGLCTFALVRRITASAQAGLAALALQTLGLLFVANMGRTVRLEPLMALLVMAGAWSALRSPLPRWRVVAGACFALALLVKFTAVAVAGPVGLAFLWFDNPDWRSRARSFGWLTLGAALVLAPTLAWLLSEPGFVRWALEGQLARPRFGVVFRLGQFANVCERFPPLVLGILAAVRMLAWNGKPAPGERTLALAAIGSTLLLVFGFKSFYSYYLVPALPLLTACLAMELDRLVRHIPAMPRRWWSPAVICAAAFVACLAYVEVYYRVARNHGVYPAHIVALLKDNPGPVYTMIPDFVFWHGQRLPDWYYKVDSYLPRVVGVLGDADFEKMLARVNAAVLGPGEFNDYPRTTALLDHDFRRAYADKDFELWLRAP